MFRFIADVQKRQHPFGLNAKSIQSLVAVIVLVGAARTLITYQFTDGFARGSYLLLFGVGFAAPALEVLLVFALLSPHNSLLASVVESSADAIITEDLKGIVTSWNRGAERMFGYSAEEVIGGNISIIIPFGAGTEIPGALERISRGESIEQYETVRQAKSGTQVNVSITWSPLRDARQRIIGASKVIRDITERRELEEQRTQLLAKERALASERALRASEAELARVARALSVGELATSIAHEVNQPLAGVVTNAEAGLRWLSHQPPDIQRAQDSLALIVRDGNRASTIIRRIREFLKKGQPLSESLDINIVIEEILALARVELTRQAINLHTHFSCDLPRVVGNKVELQQVILNLVVNAADATATSGSAKDLFIRSEALPDDAVLVSVRDCGIGIDPGNLHRMFDVFFTTKPTGIGLGLSLSRSIIESHGGTISARANDGPGLTVQFSIPGERISNKAAVAGTQA